MRKAVARAASELLIWLRAWKVTLKIKFFEPELYRDLTRPLDPADFIAVERPGESGSAVETESSSERDV
jgi:hypothetical protein